MRLSKEALAKRLVNKPEFADRGSNNDKREAALLEDPLLNELYTLDKNLNQFLVGNDADYFIHKDLKGFLRREKDKYIKGVIFCDLERLLDLRVDNSTVIIAKAFNAVATRIIDFLDSFESFQRNLFTLKKKVVHTDWLISVGRIPESFYPEILANFAQVAEFADLYGVNVASVADLAAHPTLVLDTRHFRDGDFTDRLLATVDDLDKATDGLLINSENFQALSLLEEKYRQRIKCIYIDPPYNTGNDGFLYKDAFKHSSWLTMMENRVAQSRDLMTSDGMLFCSIDDAEVYRLQTLLSGVFGEGLLANLVWDRNRKNDAKFFSVGHEYMLAYARDRAALETRGVKFREQREGIDEAKRLFRQLRNKHGDDWESIRKGWLGWLDDMPRSDPRRRMRRYSKVGPDGPYRDDGNINWPGGGGPRYEVLHPGTHRPCRLPISGWRYSTPERFWEEHAKGKIVFGPDETTVPSIASYLFEGEGQVMPSVFYSYAQTAAQEFNHLFGGRAFDNPKNWRDLVRIINYVTEDSDTILDFFAGSGTTGHAVIRLNKEDGGRRRFILVEMGEYFDTVLVPRIRKVMYSLNWKDGQPVADAVDGWQGLVKVQRLEQYEDILNSLEPVTVPDSAVPASTLPLTYLYRPEQNALRTTLDLTRPFSNRIRYGRLREETDIDLLETYLYLRGHRVRTRRIHEHDGRRYTVVETTSKQLVIWRDVDDDTDDTEALLAIADAYDDLEGLEINHTCDLRGLPEDTVVIDPDDFDRGAVWD